MKRLFLAAISFAVCGVAADNAFGAIGLTLDIKGTTGSPTISWAWTGGASATGSASGNVFLMNITGNVFKTTDASAVLSGAGSLTNTTTSIKRAFTDIDFSDLGANDALNFTTATPAFVISSGNIFSATGSGTITLSGGNTFDTVFNVGTFNMATADVLGGSHRIVIAEVAAVPEPSSMILCGFGLVGGLIAARRRARAAASAV